MLRVLGPLPGRGRGQIRSTLPPSGGDDTVIRPMNVPSTEHCRCKAIHSALPLPSMRRNAPADA